jgi:Mg-chelatase subunit ChlD
MASNGIDPLTAAQLSAAAYTPTLVPSGWTQIGNTVFSADGVNSFTVFKSTTSSQIVIAFKGTDFSSLTGGIEQFKSDIGDNGASAWESLKAQFETTLGTIQTEYPGYTISTDGHSLGGGMAQTAALEYDLSGYGQNSLPVSQGAIAQDPQIANEGGVASVVLKWTASGNTFNEVNVSGDIATFYYSTLGVKNGVYISTNTTTLPSPYVAYEALGVDTGTDFGLFGAFIGASVAAAFGAKAHSINTVISIEQGLSPSASGNPSDDTVASQIVSSSSSAIVDAIQSDNPTSSTTNGQVSETATGATLSVSLVSSNENADYYQIAQAGESTQEFLVITGGSGQTYSTEPGDITAIGDVSGGNTLVIATPDVTLLAFNDTVNIAASNATVRIGDPADFVGTISNFVQGDTIDLAGIGTASAATLGAGNVLSVTKSDGTTLNINLDAGTDYSGKTFKATPDGNGGTNITLAEGTSNLAFVFDTTGSMDPYIAAIQADSTAILNADFSNYATADVSVVSFKDPQAGYPDQVIQPFTTDQTAVQNAINSLTAGGGGDIPEGDYSGLLLALNGSAGAWDTDPDVTRTIILYTDAPVKDTYLAAQVNEYAHDLNTVVNTTTVSAAASPAVSVVDPTGAPEQIDTYTFAATAAGTTPAPVRIDTIQVGDDPTAAASVQQIATDNGGVFLQAPTPDQLVQAILKDINNPGTTTPNFIITDVTTGQTTTDAGQPYSGPVAGLTNEFIDVTTDSLNIIANVPNSFIHSGAGTDAIDVSKVNGTNVIDGGTGSNFLTGGTGDDTFFVDDRGPTSDIWSTVNKFHSGDAATIWGITPSDFDLSWVDGQGATGYTGLTLHATAAGVPTASLTLAGFTSADMTDGKLSVSFGTTAASGGVAGSTYMYVHAN